MNNTQDFDVSVSGWSLLSFLNIQLEVAEAKLLKGGSFIELPLKIKQTKSCLNIKSKNQECFLHCTLASLKFNEIPIKKRDDPRSYEPFKNHLNIQNLNFPVTTRDIQMFERNNPYISVNIYKVKKDKVSGPLYITKEEKEHHVDLLYVGTPEKHHCVLIRDLSRLISQQSNARCKLHLCRMCLSYFKSSDDLLFHKKIGCGQQMVVMPLEKDAEIKFERFTAK